MMGNIGKKRLRNNIWKFYLLSIVSGMTFFVPIFVLFLQDNGLSLTQIMLLQAFFSIVVVVLEVPTGYFADIYGRKKSLILSVSALTLAIFTYSLGYNFYQFLIAELFWAIGISLISGADLAFLYDTLKELKQEKQYKKLCGNLMFYGMISMAFASIIGGLIGEINFRWTFYATIPFVLIGLPIALSLKEPKRYKRVLKKGYVQDLFKIIKFSLVKNNKLRLLFIYLGIVAGFGGTAYWLLQPYFKLIGLDIFYFGFIFAALNIVIGISSKYAYKVEKKFGIRYSLIAIILLIGASYLLLSNFIYLFSFLFVFLMLIALGLSGPIITDCVNKMTDSNVRATILSVQNLIVRLFFAAIIPIAGWIADVYSLTQALGILGITTFVSGTIILLLLRKYKII